MNDAPGRILLVEDEINLADGIRENLEAEGYAVEHVADGRSGLEKIRTGAFDLVLLDVMLPEMDGFTVCETARGEGCDTPVLFLTAKSTPEDRIQGLEAGGDDYLPKPFNLRELLLRVSAILRRREWYGGASAASTTLRFGDNEFNFRTYQGRSWDGREQALTEKEAMILKALSEKTGEVITREEILEKAWGYEVYPSTRTIEEFINKLRRRFEPDPEHPRYLHTVRGVGYRFTTIEERES